MPAGFDERMLRPTACPAVVVGTANKYNVGVLLCSDTFRECFLRQRKPNGCAVARPR
ncbi:hypothetical protein [Arthrobacter sp. ISL-72]|uniref:hypothetical protein n=1 Tax=Arthrobacter sp. ISL-72 TaxID=2819114 RepID=UPI001BECCF14|nr:hypothetical protein [Arthrobacter sp. ISL-72]MBT2597160.1 hypothetical protein [Arthrobacter sp. ISL-72]